LKPVTSGYQIALNLDADAEKNPISVVQASNGRSKFPGPSGKELTDKLKDGILRIKPPAVFRVHVAAGTASSEAILQRACGGPVTTLYAVLGAQNTIVRWRWAKQAQ
jgi:hypothetical protein